MLELEQRYGAELKDIDKSGITDIMHLGLLVGNTCKCVGCRCFSAMELMMVQVSSKTQKPVRQEVKVDISDYRYDCFVCDSVTMSHCILQD